MPIKIPTLPLDTTTLEVVAFVLRFNTKPGFIELYEQECEKIFPAARGKVKGLCTEAYETVEGLHEQIFGHRRYLAKEVFESALSQYYNQKFVKP